MKNVGFFINGAESLYINGTGNFQLGERFKSIVGATWVWFCAVSWRG